MPKYTENILLSGSGLDRDSDKRFIAKGDTDFRLNLVPNADGKHGLLTAIKGNRKINIPSQNYGTIIGDCYDPKRNKQYIFVYADDGYHYIMQYSYEDGSYGHVIENNNKLGFDLNYLITDACVIGDYLFWNPRSSSPRCLNVVWADNYQNYDNAELGETYALGKKLKIFGRLVEVTVDDSLAEDLIADTVAGNYSLSRDTGERTYYTTNLYFYNYMPQPLYRPTGQYGTDTARKSNNLRKSVFQFCYRYVGVDGSISRTSPFSESFIPYSSETYSGEVQSVVSTDNKITLSVMYPQSDLYSFANLESIEVLFRASDPTGWGVWRIAETIPWEKLITETNNITYTFYNDKNYVVADQDEIERAYSALPVTANAQASLMNNRIAYLGLTEGLTNIKPEVALTSTMTEIPITAPGALNTAYTVTQTTDAFGYKYLTGVLAGTTAGKMVKFTVDSKIYNYITVASDSTASTYVGHLVTFVNANIPNAFKVANDGSNRLRIYLPSEGGELPASVMTINLYDSGAASFYKYKGFKSGAEHQFCIYYYDKLMRRSEALVSDALKIYIPFITENTITNASFIYRNTINWSLNHPPPDDAVYWKFGYAGNSTMSYFIQTDITNFYYDDVSRDASSPYSGNSSMDITTWQESYKAAFPHVNVDPYEYQAGDRVRVIVAAGAATYAKPVTTYFDEEIIGFDADLNLILLNTVVSPPASLAAGAIVEIYRPQKTTDINYYEIGPLFGIYEDEGVRYHEGLDPDHYQTAAQPATGTFTDGDIYHLTRYAVMATSDLYPMESMWSSDFYDSEVWGQGKVGFVGYIGKVTVNNIRYSDPYIQGSKINGLSSFQYLNYDTITDKYGKITGAVEVGHTLRVYLETNGVSIPVGRTSYTDATGNDTVVASDKILGVQRIDTEGYGTVFPESICQVGTHVYFFDSRKGCFVRDSLNGAFPISGKFATEAGVADFKMESWFKEKALAIKTNGESNFKVLVGWDEVKKLLVVAFDDTSTGENDDIIAFHEPSNRWTTFLIRENNGATLNTMPSWLSQQGNNLFSYEGGDTYIHDDAAGYCNFYGVQYGIENRVYSAEGNNLVKLYEDIVVHCNQQLDLDTIYVHGNETSETYMQSRIPSSWWKKIEGKWYAPYLRNMLTNGILAVKDLFNGDFLRGYVIENRFTKSSVTTELNIMQVDVTSKNSNV